MYHPEAAASAEIVGGVSNVSTAEAQNRMQSNEKSHLTGVL